MAEPASIDEAEVTDKGSINQAAVLKRRQAPARPAQRHLMVVYQLRPVDFSLLSLLRHNPAMTSWQLCSSLHVLPPNLVGRVNSLAKRELIFG